VKPLGHDDIQAAFDALKQADASRQSSADDGNGAKPSGRRLNVLRPSDCLKGNPRPYVVKGVAAQGDVVILAAPPGAGKSLLAPHAGYGIAQGRAVFGRRVRQGRVLYLAPEDGAGMQMRVRALFERHGDAPDFLLVPDAVDLRDPSSRDLGAVEALTQEFQPVLIVVDTVARAFPGLKENESEEMGRVVTVVRGLTAICGSAVLLLHHLPKEGSTPRGHGSLHGDADVTLIIEGQGGDPRTVKMLKNRNGASDATFAFTVATETLATDDDGDAITAALVEEMEGPPRARGPKLTPTEATALRYLADLVVGEGKPLPRVGSFPDGLYGVPEQRWRDECFSRRLIMSDKPDSHQKAFKRASEGLMKKGAAAARDGWVWLTQAQGVSN
jgi:hypothetical protein